MPKRVDRNQGEIVEALRDIGCSVLHLHEVGKGCPDILVGFRQCNFLLEIKDGAKPPSKRKLTGPEKKFFFSWQGHVAVVKDVYEALRVIGAINE